jgi:hypothetical protein
MPTKKSEPSVSVNSGFVIKIVLLLAVVGGVLALYFGPYTAYKTWEDLSGDAHTEVENVVQRGLAAHVSQTSGPFNPALKFAPPSVHKLGFFVNYMVMTLEDEIQFRGVSSQGNFSGTYNRHTGEVDCTADVGAYVVPGLEEAKESDEKIKITGMYKAGKLECKVNGKPAVIREAPKRDAGEEPGRPKADKALDGFTKPAI